MIPIEHSKLLKYCRAMDIINLSKTGIYCITHIKYSHKYYVGSTGIKRSKNIKSQGFYLRWRLHLHELQYRHHPNQKLQHIANKYGLSGFRFSILEIVPSCNKILTRREQYWMDKLKVLKEGFNLFPFARSSLGRFVPNNGPSSKSVCQYNLNGKFIRLYPSAAEAGRILEASYKHIGDCCNGRYGRRSVYGYIWRFINDRIDKHPLPAFDTTIKKITQYSLTGKFIKNWNSISSVYRKLGISIGNISSCIHKKRNNAGGYIWKLTDV